MDASPPTRTVREPGGDKLIYTKKGGVSHAVEKNTPQDPFHRNLPRVEQQGTNVGRTIKTLKKTKKQNMKNLFWNAAILAAAICLLPACSSEDDDEILERQSRSGFPVLRKSAEEKPIVVCSGSATRSYNNNIKVSASWTCYKVPAGSAVNPGNHVSITGHASDGSMCKTKNLEYSFSGTSVSATATIEVTSASGSSNSISVSLSGSNGTGSITFG